MIVEVMDQRYGKTYPWPRKTELPQEGDNIIVNGEARRVERRAYVLTNGVLTHIRILVNS